MNRILLTLAFVIGGSYLGSTFVNARSAEESNSAKVSVRTFADSSSSSTPQSGVLQTGKATDNPRRPQNASTGVAAEQRDYRREVQYDSSILDIRSQLHGVARPQKNAVMSSLEAGRIMTVHQQEGTKISAGDKLVSLDDRLAQAQVDAAQIEAERVGTVQRAELAYKQAERRLNRLQQAGLKSATAGFEVEEARSQMEQAQAERDAATEARSISEANLKLAEERLRRNTIYAPFDGVVVQIHQKVGTTVDPSLPVVTLANLDVLEVEMYVPIDRFGTLQPGGRLSVQAGAPINRELIAEVRSVSPVIDSASNTFRCVLVIDNANGQLPAGFSVLLTATAAENNPPVASGQINHRE